MKTVKFTKEEVDTLLQALAAATQEPDGYRSEEEADNWNDKLDKLTDKLTN